MKSTPQQPALYPTATGFPSPAADYQSPPLDLNRLLIRHPAATFFFKFNGHHGHALGIRHGDLLIIDRSIKATRGDQVLLERNGEWVISLHGDGKQESDACRIWGTVIWIIRQP